MCVGLPMKRNLGVLHLFPPIIYTEQTRKSKNRYIHPRGSCYRSERGRLWLFTEETKCFLLFFFSFFFFSAKTESKLEKGVKQRRVNKREYWGIKAIPEGRGMWISEGAKEHEKKRPRISTKLHNIWSQGLWNSLNLLEVACPFSEPRELTWRYWTSFWI